MSRPDLVVETVLIRKRRRCGGITRAVPMQLALRGLRHRLAAGPRGKSGRADFAISYAPRATLLEVPG